MGEMAIDRLARPPVRDFAHPRAKAGPALIPDVDLIAVTEVSR